MAEANFFFAYSRQIIAEEIFNFTYGVQDYSELRLQAEGWKLLEYRRNFLVKWTLRIKNRTFVEIIGNRMDLCRILEWMKKVML